MNIFYNGSKYLAFKKELENINIPEIIFRIEDGNGSHSLKNNFIYISSFYSTEKKHGYGSKALKEIIKIADKHQINFYLFPYGTSKSFYEKFRFIYPENPNNYYIPGQLYRFCDKYIPEIDK